MKHLRTIPSVLLAAALLLGVMGCATRDVNPPQARANTGYVDFYANPTADLNWEVERIDVPGKGEETVFSELKSPAGGVLRLSFMPGQHHLRVGILNRVITHPLEIEVEVAAGKITPVRVTLTPTGTAYVETRQESYGGTAKGRVGQRVKYGADETTRYDLTAMADAPIDYQPKERMSYAR
jgi:hypothetical protein